MHRGCTTKDMEVTMTARDYVEGVAVVLVGLAVGVLTVAALALLLG